MTEAAIPTFDFPSLSARADAIIADLETVVVHSRALIARSAKLCRMARQIRGGSNSDPDSSRISNLSPDTDYGAVRPRVGRPALTQNDALWQFLENHRGRMFCTQCIATALFATKRIDRAVIGAEGRGARRQYGPCASCGKERLLCGLMG